MTPGSDEFPQREPIGLCSPRQHPVWNQLIARPAFSSRDILLDHSKSRLSEYARPALDLCDAAIYEQLRSGDVAGIVGCEKIPQPLQSHQAYRTCRAEQCWKSSSCVAAPFLRKPAGRSAQVCRWSPGSPRSRGCSDPLSRLSVCGRTTTYSLCTPAPSLS